MEDFTPKWQGRVRNTQRPSLRGTPAVGSTVTPVKGRWTGGWTGSGSSIGVRACRTAAGDGCVAMTPSFHHGQGSKKAEIRPSYRGWFVGAIEMSGGYLNTVPDVGHVSYPDPSQADPTPRPAAAVAVSPLVGPVQLAPRFSQRTAPG